MNDRKSEILELSAKLLRRKSFSAFSYTDLSVALGIRKASIHHHFPSKESLGLALVDFYRANAEALLAELLARAPSPGAALHAFLSDAEAITLDGTHDVCPHGAFDENADLLPDSIVESLARLRGWTNARMAELLAAAREAGEVRFDGDPEEQATFMMAAIEGARATARGGDRGAFRAVLRQLQRSMGLTAGAPAGTR